MQTKYLYSAVALVVLVLLAGGAWYMAKHPRSATTTTTPTATSTGNTASTTDIVSDLGNGITATGPGKVELVPVDSSVKKPSLTGPIIIASTLSPDVQAVLRTKEEGIIADLKKSPDRVDLWLMLGFYRKQGQDYKGAEEAWVYVTKAAPKNVAYVAYGDLGNLYMDFLKDYPKAEASYKAAIAIKPDFIDYYRQLFTLYTSFYKTNTSAAADIIAQGLKANPNNKDLLQLQAQLKS